MEKSETIVADRTCEYGNISHESSGDNVLRNASSDHPGGLASIRAIALSECCSIVISRTHSRRWSRVNECAEPVACGRRQYLHVNRVYVHGEHSGVEAIARIQGVMCKVGKDLGLRTDGGMLKANLTGCSRPDGCGRSSYEISNNKEKERRATGYWLSLRQWKNRLLPVRAMQPYVFHPPELREEQTFIPLNWGLSMHQTEREGCM